MKKEKFYIAFDTLDGTKENPRMTATYVEVGTEIITGTVEEVGDRSFQIGCLDDRLWAALVRYVKANS